MNCEASTPFCYMSAAVWHVQEGLRFMKAKLCHTVALLTWDCNAFSSCENIEVKQMKALWVSDCIVPPQFICRPNLQKYQCLFLAGASLDLNHFGMNLNATSQPGLTAQHHWGHLHLPEAERYMYWTSRLMPLIVKLNIYICVMSTYCLFTRPSPSDYLAHYSFIHGFSKLSSFRAWWSLMRTDDHTYS